VSLNPRRKNTEPDTPGLDDYNIAMANPRLVVDPFTKNENHMKRNTTDTRWVADDDRPKAGPSKNVQYVTQRSPRASREASVFDELYNVSPTSHTHVSSRDRTQSPPLSLTESFKYAARHDSLVSPISPLDLASLEQTRKHSGATVFPFYPTSIKKPEPKPKELWWKAAIRDDSPPTPWYRVPREIYQVGPGSEGQKVWKAVKEMRKKRRKNAETKQDIPVQPKQKKHQKPLPRPPPSNINGVLYPPLRAREADVQRRAEQAKIRERAEKDIHLNPWWKPQGDKRPGLKSKMSNSGPLMTSKNGSTANIGVPPQSPKDKKKGKQKEVERDGTPLTFWRDKFVGPTFEANPFRQKKRRDSDASFGCQGVESVVLDRYQVGELESDDEKEMLPEPLFKGKGKGISGRDTKFYQPYVEVLKEY
jgi:hypothetical protein